MVTKHPNSIYVLAAAPRQPLEIIQAPTYGFAPANALTNVTRNASLTFAGNGSTNLASVTVNGQATALYRDQTFATTTALALVSGSNAFTVVAVDTAGAALTNQFSAALPVTQHLTYDLNGNLTSDGTRGFAYDNIGNRITAQFGGDTNGSNLKIISYTANSLNQYTGIVTPGLQDVCGAALATNAVTVNGGLADRRGEYFHREISVANTNQPVWQNVTNIAGTFTNKGGSVFPANAPTLAYDADGNLTFDGVWNYQWDGENRLISMNMTTVANIAATNRLRLDFAYDYMGRRIQKTVSVWNTTTSGFQTSTANTFVYDGWNLVAIINPQSSILQSFVWGNDLSGTMTRAGGVGGLLMANLSGTNCFAGYDGNGNLTAFINAADKTLAARYEYSPYGQLIRETGLLAAQMPFRYSTKFWDEESGMVYYGYRYYSPIMGKWIGRDSSQEKGGLNLYAFNFNNAVSRIDTLGDTSSYINLGQGYSGRVDTFNTGGSASFELHIYDSGGNEAGIVGPDGWINKHGFTGPPELPDDVMRVVKGVAVNTARDAGMIAKGASIRNWLWNGTMGAINRSGRIGGAIVGILAIQAAVQSGLQAAEDAKDYARDAKMVIQHGWILMLRVLPLML